MAKLLHEELQITKEDQKEGSEADTSVSCPICKSKNEERKKKKKKKKKMEQKRPL
jgi:transposase-like protein